jgi:hypothetical protein
MTQEVLKLALDFVETVHVGEWVGSIERQLEVITAIKEALAQEQEPVAWGVDWGKAGDIPCVSIIKRLPKGGIEVMAVEYAPYSYTTPPQRTEQNFCSRCGKRLGGINSIHTCTPPMEKNT